MKQQHHPTDIKSYETGVKSDANKELLGQRKGDHVDAKDMRSISMDGDNLAKKKIKGEDLLYPNIDNRCVGGTGLPLSELYECMMSQSINGHIVEIWGALDVYNLPALIRIDGKIVAMSEDLPIVADRPLEYHKNENCIGGEFYTTDNFSKPLVFNVKDLLINSGVNVGNDAGLCSQKYFDLFNLDEYVVGISSSLFKIAFISQPTSVGGGFNFVFGSQGLLAGSYSYSYRYATEDGDRGAWSPVSEMIPVINGKSSISDEHPKAGNFSSDPFSAFSTTFGNHLRLKYDNISGFEFIEVRRDGWYLGSTLDSPPVSEIIGAFPIESGLGVVDILDYASNTETEEVLNEEDLLDTPEDIDRAKAVRYFNSKLWLMNVSYIPRDVDGDVTFIDSENPLFPTIEKIGKKGHSHVYNSTYFKSNMRGEANGFGLVLFGKAGSKTYATNIQENFQFPNRRDEASTETIGTSYLGIVTAANSDGAVGLTHEVFDLDESIGKDGLADVNILDQTILGVDTGPYTTLHPVSQVDNISNYDDRVNHKVKKALSGDYFDYNPQGFGIDYYSQGVAFKGIETDGLDRFDGFSVVQTNPAKKVLAQGLGFYDISPADGALGSNAAKERNSIIVNLPDLDSEIGLTPQVIDEIMNNVGPDSPFKVQMVSPLGYFSEIYTWTKTSILGVNVDAKAKSVDMISYCRVLNAKNGAINPGFGNLDGIGAGYTAFGTWRDTSNSSSFPANSNPYVFDIIGIEEVPTKSGVGLNYRLTLGGPNAGLIYSQQYAGSGLFGAPVQDIDDPKIKQWTEPVYAFNIIKEEAQVNAGLLSSYNYTGHYIKFKSKILEADGTSSQSAVLVSERWEDCIRGINGEVNNDYTALERFTWVTSLNGDERRWLNVTGKTSTEVATIENDILLNGFHVITDASGSYNIYGTYTHQESIVDLARMFTLTFNNLEEGDIVEVRYDNRIPVRVFGGDTYINEHIWAYQDNEYNKNGNTIDPSHDFSINIPFPLPQYKKSPDYEILRTTTGIDRYLNSGLDMKFDSGLFGSGSVMSAINPCSIRQLILMWTAETRVNLSFAFNYEVDKESYSQQFLPMKNYIPRPHKWKSGQEDTLPPDNNNMLEDNNMIEQYFDDYGSEWVNWGKGGFRFKPQVNIDYSKKQNTDIITSVPAIGFEEETDFCTRVLWSVTRPINVQDSPTVKTFPPSNFHDISDNTGEIKFAWDADSGKGNNLYSITNNGVCLLLTDKRILSEINSNELATIGSDIGGVVSELWINKEIGMDRETWKTWAEYSNALFWTNSKSSYMLSDNVIKDIANDGEYLETVRSEFIPKFIDEGGSDSKMAGVYDILHKEYYATVDNRSDEEGHSTLIYGTTQEALQCTSSYNYDKYLSINNDLYGMKNMETYKLGVGNIIDGSEYECSVTGVSNADAYSDKEFIRIRVNSNTKPKRIEFFDDYEQYKSGVPSSIVDATSSPVKMKDYHGFECYIPRKELAPHSRQQGRLVIFKVISDDNEDFFISTTGVQYKTLK